MDFAWSSRSSFKAFPVDVNTLVLVTRDPGLRFLMVCLPVWTEGPVWTTFRGRLRSDRGRDLE